MEGRKLIRSANDRKISGVCGGIGEYLNIDSTAIRLLWAVGTFFSVGGGIILYIIAAVIMPEEI